MSGNHAASLERYTQKHHPKEHIALCLEKDEMQNKNNEQPQHTCSLDDPIPKRSSAIQATLVATLKIKASTVKIDKATLLYDDLELVIVNFITL